MEPFTSESKCFTMWRSKNSSSSSSPSGASSPPASGADWQDWWKSSAGRGEGRDGEVLVGAAVRATEELRYRWGPGTRRQCGSPCRGREPCGGETAWVSNSSSQLSQGCCLQAAAKGKKKRWWLNMWKSSFPITNSMSETFLSQTLCWNKSSLYTYSIYLYVCIYIYFKKRMLVFCSCMCLDWLSSVLIILQTL